MVRDPIRLVIVDDHDLLREGIKARFANEPGVEIVAEGKTGKDAVCLCKTHQPDILLLDISMPVMNGLDAAREITQNENAPHILFLSVYDDPEYVAEAMRVGAKGYVLKNVLKPEMMEAVAKVSAGETYLPCQLSDRLDAHSAERAARVNGYGLTQREQDVLRHLATGVSNKQVAYALDISVRTVESHRSAIRVKTGCKSAVELARVAEEIGITA